jgi:hypothetical protein
MSTPHTWHAMESRAMISQRHTTASSGKKKESYPFLK